MTSYHARAKSDKLHRPVAKQASWLLTRVFRFLHFYPLEDDLDFDEEVEEERRC